MKKTLFTHLVYKTNTVVKSSQLRTIKRHFYRHKQILDKKIAAIKHMGNVTVLQTRQQTQKE